MMARLATTVTKSIEDYRGPAGDDAVDEIRRLAEPFAGARVLHVNSTVYGGGVAEILSTLVPLMRDVGLKADWSTMDGTPEFFAFTKNLHNALQGSEAALPGISVSTGISAYIELNAAEAEQISCACGEYDFVVVHDPQPAPLIQYLRHRLGEKTKWIWRCHIDLSSPVPGSWNLIMPFVEQYDASIFTAAAYVKEGIGSEHVVIIPPSIDPLSPKNVEIPAVACKHIIAGYGVDPNRPLLVQISRFDPWKDPLGVIDSYRLVRKEVPEVQLALVGSMAADDPEGVEYYCKTLEHAAGDRDVHILSNLHGVGNADVNAFQTAADVVIQKSVREGFGLTVSESLWKAKPVVASNVGGIPIQIQDGRSGFLVSSVQECAEKALMLLGDMDLRRQIGVSGREHVRRNFLSTRHLADYLRLFAGLRG
ncbi:MAG: glycosyltransferase [Firmicutes bacterium]|jgi:trehalose synthase|nr:glycosyltransferase [Bacillota bacterium]